MTKIEKVKQLISNPDELIRFAEDPDILIDMIKQCSKDDARSARVAGLKAIRNKNGLRIFDKIRGGFGLYLYEEISPMPLKMDAKGFYNTLLECLIADGTYRVHLPCGHTKKDMSTHFKVGTRKIGDWLKEIEELGLIKTINTSRYNIDIYVNPTYYRLGKYVHDEVLEMFGI